MASFAAIAVVAEPARSCPFTCLPTYRDLQSLHVDEINYQLARSHQRDRRLYPA
jgi:hypothetical protein